jgi:hypothetical protein
VKQKEAKRRERIKNQKAKRRERIIKRTSPVAPQQEEPLL